MEEKDSQKKPLRSTQNKIKDIYNTYIKNDGGRQIPISDKDDADNENIENKPEVDKMESESESQLNDAETKAAFDELNKQINDLQNENADLKEQVLRKVAEFENLRRRTIKEKQDLIEYSNAKLLENLISLLDDMDNAVSAAEKAGESGALFDGLKMIREKAKKHFADEGVTEMRDAAGEDFDVEKHDAIMRMPHELPEDKVVQVVQKGYMIKDKVLRHAKVVTSAGKQD